MNLRWSLLYFCIVLAAPAAPKKTAPPLPAGNRFLFIVDTSAAMGRLEHGGRQAVFDLIYSGVDSQMRPGDTFGVWTFNQGVSAGLFPMQNWDPEKNLELASRVGLFLKAQSYQQSARLDDVLKKAHTLIKGIKEVNIFIIAAGDCSLAEKYIEGNLNTAWEGKAKEARKAKKPVITALVAQRGKIAGWSVSTPGEPIKALETLAKIKPPPAQPPAPSDPAVAATQAPTKPPVHSTVAPIIMRGSASAKPAPATAAMVASNFAAPATAPNPEVGSAPPTVAVTSDESAVLTPAANSPADAPEPGALNATQTAPAEATASPTPSPAPEAGPAVAAEQPAAAPVPAPAAATANQTAPAASLSGTTPAPLPVAAREKTAESEAPATKTGSALAAMAVAPEPELSPMKLWLAGTALFGIAMGFLVLFYRRSFPRVQSTFITQSLDRSR